MTTQATGWLVLAALFFGGPARSQETAEPAVLDFVLVTAKRAERASRGATGLDLDLLETPQSISIVTAAQMRDFGATDINQALRLATGITVESWETNRTNYLARGFEIKNTQIDGIGLPNNWGIVTGAVDAYQYEKIEVIRGANGLLTGVGNSSGTVNFVRKRPTNDRQGELAVTSGSESLLRVEGDFSAPLAESGRWAGRLTGAWEDGDSYLRGMTDDRAFLAAVIDGQVGERATLALGYTWHETRTDGNLWGALVLDRVDGTQAEFPRSSTTAQDWSQWDTEGHNAFAEYTFALSDDWELKAAYNYRDFEDDSRLFYVYTYAGLELDDTGLWGWPGRWLTLDESHLVDVNLAGRFDAFGRGHEAILGVAYSDGETTTYDYGIPADEPAWGALPAFPYAGDVVPEPQWGDRGFYSVLNQRITRAYGATRLALAERWRAVLGFNWTEYRRDGEQVGAPAFDQTEEEVSPYAGLVFEIADHAMLYASYSDIYQPQDQYDIDLEYLDPSKGLNYEVGAKASWFDNRLVTTIALFKAEQENLATLAGVTGTCSTGTRASTWTPGASSSRSPAA
jgi:outer membrane receptor for ferric coprogen and ferric-rhodotorulic acid